MKKTLIALGAGFAIPVVFGGTLILAATSAYAA